MAICQTYITYDIDFEVIKYIPEHMEKPVEKLLWSLPGVDGTIDCHSGFRITIEFDKFQKFGKEKYEKLLKNVLDSIEKVCIEYNTACSVFEDL